jgi:hypothetical protein
MPPASQRVKLLLTYDILPETQDQYYQFMLGEVVPAMQALGLFMSGAWHTAYGEYPVRLVEFIADDHAALTEILDGPQWQRIETRLLEYVTHYRRRIVRLREDQFQF